MCSKKIWILITDTIFFLLLLLYIFVFKLGIAWGRYWNYFIFSSSHRNSPSFLFFYWTLRRFFLLWRHLPSSFLIFHSYLCPSSPLSLYSLLLASSRNPINTNRWVSGWRQHSRPHPFPFVVFRLDFRPNQKWHDIIKYANADDQFWINCLSHLPEVE